MEYIIYGGIFALAAAVLVYVYIRRTKDDRPVGAPSVPSKPDPAAWDNAWNAAIANGMDPNGQAAKAFIRAARRVLGSWNPPT